MEGLAIPSAVQRVLSFRPFSSVGASTRTAKPTRAKIVNKTTLKQILITLGVIWVANNTPLGDYL